MYKTIWTDVGRAKRANAEIQGTLVSITHIAVGDGNGADIEPTQDMTELVNEQYRRPVDSVFPNDTNAGWIDVAGRVLVADGGWWIREIGLFDSDGDLVVIANYPATYKPVLAEGAGQDLYLLLVLATENAAVINLTVNPAYAVASRDYVEKAIGNAGSVRRVNASGPLLASDRFILVDDSSGAEIVLTFRSALASDAVRVKIKRTAGIGTIRLQPQAGETIEWQDELELPGDPSGAMKGQIVKFYPDTTDFWLQE